jgi:hypothetical protein
MKRFYDRNRGKSPSYHINDKVWLEGKYMRSLRPTKKFDDKRYGPFIVLENIGKSAHKLKLPSSWHAIYPVFNEVLLHPYHPPTFPNQQQPPPPPVVNVEGHPEYEVEEVLGVQKFGRTLKYLIKWKGYSHEENTWEPKKNLVNAEESITDYYKKHPDSLRLLSSSKQEHRSLRS